MPRFRETLLIAALFTPACGGSDDAAVPATDTTAAAAGPCSGVAAGTVTAGGIGAVQLGAGAASLPEGCTARDTTFVMAEGLQETGRVVMINGAPVIAITTGTPNNTIDRILITDPAFRTERGVGVGSTVADLRQANGPICAYPGEGATVVQPAQMPGVSYMITWTPADAAAGRAVFDAPQPPAVIDSSRITAVLISGGATACGGS